MKQADELVHSPKKEVDENCLRCGHPCHCGDACSDRACGCGKCVHDEAELIDEE